MKQLLLLRHGSVGQDGHFVGRSDLSLTELGVGQIRQVAAQVGAFRPERVFVSPLRRCEQSAQLLDFTGAPPVTVEPALQEIDFGRWELQTFADVSAREPDLVADWHHLGDQFSFPGGERLGDFYRRLTEFAKIVEEGSEERCLLVTHGGVIRHLLCYWLGLPFTKNMVFSIAPGMLTTIHLHSKGGVLHALNHA